LTFAKAKAGAKAQPNTPLIFMRNSKTMPILNFSGFLHRQ
jgi:hypothetical protein